MLGHEKSRWIGAAQEWLTIIMIIKHTDVDVKLHNYC